METFWKHAILLNCLCKFKYFFLEPVWIFHFSQNRTRGHRGQKLGAARTRSIGSRYVSRQKKIQTAMRPTPKRGIHVFSFVGSVYAKSSVRSVLPSLETPRTPLPTSPNLFLSSFASRHTVQLQPRPSQCTVAEAQSSLKNFARQNGSLPTT